MFHSTMRPLTPCPVPVVPPSRRGHHLDESVIMGKTKLCSVSVQCEWSSCTFKGQTMEELSEHMALHLKEHLGDGDAMEELGERQHNFMQHAMV